MLIMFGANGGERSRCSQMPEILPAALGRGSRWELPATCVEVGPSLHATAHNWRTSHGILTQTPG